jgi:hypothetical protein
MKKLGFAKILDPPRVFGVISLTFHFSISRSGERGLNGGRCGRVLIGHSSSSFGLVGVGGWVVLVCLSLRLGLRT